jgi:hypothetical protein
VLCTSAMADPLTMDPMQLVDRALDKINEAKGCVELGQKKRARKASLEARRLLEDLGRVLAPRKAKGPDPRQEWLPNVRKA